MRYKRKKAKQKKTKGVLICRKVENVHTENTKKQIFTNNKQYTPRPNSLTAPLSRKRQPQITRLECQPINVENRTRMAHRNEVQGQRIVQLHKQNKNEAMLQIYGTSYW